MKISNFSKNGYESRHNLNYWNNNEYYGFGVSAHGYIDSVRYSNPLSLKQYIQNPLYKETRTILTQKEKLEEEIFLGFRKCAGININLIYKKFGIDFEKKFAKVLSKYTDYIYKTQNGYAFNDNGFLLSNEILPEFLLD